jgi:hypothetical protein
MASWVCKHLQPSMGNHFLGLNLKFQCIFISCEAMLLTDTTNSFSSVTVLEIYCMAFKTLFRGTLLHCRHLPGVFVLQPELEDCIIRSILGIIASLSFLCAGVLMSFSSSLHS